MLAMTLAAKGTYYDKMTNEMPHRDGSLRWQPSGTPALGTLPDFEYDV